MPTATEEAPKNVTPEPAPAPTFSDFLDQALESPAPAPAPEASVNPEVAPVAPTAPATQEKTQETTSSKTPTSILDQLSKTGSEQALPETESKAEVEKLPENTPVAAQTAFAKLTKELREAKTKLKEFETKVSDRSEKVEKSGEPTEADPELKNLQEQLAQFKAERDELDGELRFSRLEATREFKTSIAEPMKAAAQNISDIAKSYELKPNALLEAANEPDSAKRRVALKELTGEMDAVDALAVRVEVDKMVSLNNKREAMVKDSQATLQAMEKAEEEQEKSERTKYDTDAKKAFGEVWNDFQEQLPILKKIDGNETWNKTIDDLRVNAEKLDAEPLDHKQRAALTYQAVSLPLMVQIFKDYVGKTNQELGSLRSSLADYRKATPGAGGGQIAEKVESLDSSLSFLDALEKS